MRRRSLLLVPLALLGATGPSLASVQARPGAASAPSPKALGPRKISPPPPPPRREATTTVIKVDTSTHEIDLARLPSVEAPIEGVDKMPPLPAEGTRTEPREIHVVNSAEAARPGGHLVGRGRGEVADPWSAGSARSGPRSVRVEGATEGLTAISWGTGVPVSMTMTSTCDASLAGKSSAMRDLRWQHLSRRGDGGYRLINALGWLDRGSCKLVQGPSSEVQLAVVASFEGQPMVLAARVGDRLLVVTPQLHNLQQDGPSKGRSSTALIALSLVTPQRGGAVTVAGDLSQISWSQWRSGLSGVLTPSSPLPSIALRVDVSQALGEPAPLTLVTVQRPTAQEQRPVSPAAAQVAPRPRPPRASLSINDGLSDPFD